jgi:lipopolysaccharide/colanic/teichoic acid biosynthesis glycosyltransferase
VSEEPSGASAPPRPGLPRPVAAALAAGGLLVAAPVLAVAAAAIAATSGLPVFFRQVRVGRHGRPFTMIKLRTMRKSGVGPKVTAGNDPRITPVGRFLRRTKLDELPELWNVLRGEMSFVGPRPEVADYVHPESALWREVLSVRPGLTDPVTLRLRHEEALLESVAGDREKYYRETLQPRKLEGYVSYLRRRSWWSDVGVLMATAGAILRPRRADSELKDRADSELKDRADSDPKVRADSDPKDRADNELERVSPGPPPPGA